MRTIKRILPLLLSLLMVIGTFTAVPLSAAAATTSVETDAQLLSAFSAGKKDIKLTADISISEQLVVPSGKTITLDLAGFAINRGLKTCVENGSVIRVEAGATLTITDKGGNNAGSITGGASLNGGGICNYGTLTYEGGALYGNKATDKTEGYGGGIYNAAGATLNLGGGLINNNEARFGGGIYNGGTLKIYDGVLKTKVGALVKETPVFPTVTNNKGTVAGSGIYNGGDFSFSGKAELSGNNKDKDVYLAAYKPIVCGKLSYQNPFGVAADSKDDVVITQDFYKENSGKAELFFFANETGSQTAQLSSATNPELMLKKVSGKSLVQIFTNGELTEQYEVDDPQTAWNSCKEHVKQNSYDNKYSKDDLITYIKVISGNLSFEIPTPSKLGYEVEKAGTGGYGKLKDTSVGVVTLGSDWNISTRQTIDTKQNIVLDLNGHIVNRGLNYDRKGDGNLFSVGEMAKFTILDSDPKAKHSGTWSSVKGGILTDGAGDDVGGGIVIYNCAEFDMLGGTIYRCCTDEHGGAAGAV